MNKKTKLNMAINVMAWAKAEIKKERKK